jgi:hypothetical protein
MASGSPATSIQHRYALGPAFIPETWHLIQVAFSSNQPGGMSIIVDGLVGRDVTLLGSTATPAIPAAMTLPGDHLTLPSLVLREELLATPSVSTEDASALRQDKIQLDACAQVGGAMVTGGPAVKALLPERGMVRIGNEYISYQSIDANGVLNDCVRARRQSADAHIRYNAMNQIVFDWDDAHKLEAHAIGAQVLPGGFAIRELSDSLWRGGCSLAQMMPDGDPIHQYQVHAAVMTELPLTVIPAGSLGLTLSGNYLGDFPMRGYVMVNNSQLFYYDNVNKLPSLAKGLVNTSHWVRSLVVPDPKDPDKTIITDEWRTGIPADIPVGSTVVLVSVELKGDPTTDRAYHLVRNNGSNPWTSQSATAPVMVQLYDARSAESAPNGGRAEWLTYSSIDSRTTHLTSVDSRVSFLLNITAETKEVEIIPSTNPKTYYSVTSYRPGFWFDKNDRSGARGKERTAFAKSDLKTYSSTDHRFPIGTRVIPVQTSLANAHLFEAGDMVTLAPVVMGNAASGQRPLQMCVRYSAHEGFPESTTSTSWPWHVTSGNFAFTEALPDTWNLRHSNFHVLCWPCWTPEIDLSPIQTATWQTHRQGWVLPWGNAYAPDFDPAVRKGEITFLTDANSAAGKAGMIDAIHAGAQPGWQQGGQVQAHIMASSDAIWLDDNPLIERTVVVANQGIFSTLYGIVEIGGETFAYKQWDNEETDPLLFARSTTRAWLIGRSLLGSTARIHKGPELILRLPIGPVTEVIGTIPAAEDLTKPLSTVARSKGQMGINFIGPLNLASDPNASFNSPAVLLTSRDGREQEITVLPNNHTAPWLRGMYNTTPVGWEDRPKVPAITSPPTDGSQPPPLPSIPNLAPLAIGWWPRYPSGYPKNLSMRSPVERSAILRCRSYAWAGFPLRFHDAQFSGTDLAEVTVLSTGGGLFDLQALALDGRMDWGVAKMVSLLDGESKTAFDSEIFKVLTPDSNSRLNQTAGAIRTVDGAELRIIWTYHDEPLIEEDEASPAEWLQKTARNGNSAPMIGPVYLRARAPNKIISVER